MFLSSVDGPRWALLLLALLGVALCAAAPPDARLPAPEEGAWHYAPAAPSLFRTFSDVPRLHVAVLCLPLWAHLRPVAAVAEELMLRGHQVTYFVERAAWCDRLLPPPHRDVAARTGSRCLHVPNVSDVAEALRHPRHALSLHRAVLQHHEEMLGAYVAAARAQPPFTTFLCDGAAPVCPSVARSLSVPVVQVQPAAAAAAPSLHLPAPGSGLPRAMSAWQRAVSAVYRAHDGWLRYDLARRVSAVRALHGIPPLETRGVPDPVLAPALWGLDLPQPLCANVHAVGPLLPLAERTRHVPLPSADRALRAFLDGCGGGAVYVDLGRRARLSDAALRALLAGLLAMPSSSCLLWRLGDEQSDSVVRPALANATTTTTVLLRPALDAPAAAVLRHPNVFALVTPCGAPAVLDAVEARVPLVGLPRAGDERDACQRVREAAVGVVLDATPLRAAHVDEALRDVLLRGGALQRHMRPLRRTAAFLGGTAQAASIVEGLQYNLLLRGRAAVEGCGTGAAADPLLHGLWPLAVAAPLSTVAWGWLLRRATGWSSAAVRTTFRRRPAPGERPRVRVVPRQRLPDVKHVYTATTRVHTDKMD
ncbi:glucuronosyltransferase [Strigomonas culicis]|uniref:Glucuronosyltransferase n=1 Tax=Strigomonas culicis TaxID=28005 RepID=S9VFJ2_9TRYP|nr:glucuronosyltransferase [Strigomonas culicis]|eukprot:EPY21925.1 glucuronosyltransferase [Strigomonas culicis]